MSSGASVSTILPAYRAARTIGRAIESILAQTRPPEEILVVDDGSPDDLVEALSPYRDRIELIRRPNGGAASARNLGIEASRGGFITFLDADDCWEPSKIEHQLEIFSRNPEVGLTSCRFFSQQPGRPRTHPDVIRDVRRFGVCALDRVVQARGSEVFSLATRVMTSAVMIRREVLGEHRFVPGLEPAEDRDLWARLIALHPAYISSEPLITLVLEPGSLSRSDVDVDFGNMIRVVRRHADVLGRRGLRRWEAAFFRLWASCQLGAGRPRQAFAPAASRLYREPLSPEGWWVLFKSLAPRDRPTSVEEPAQ
jgi:glycosyltransferase involved in cell wall biosynthesis